MDDATEHAIQHAMELFQSQINAGHVQYVRPHVLLQDALDNVQRWREALNEIAGSRIPYAGRASADAIDLVEIAERALRRR